MRIRRVVLLGAFLADVLYSRPVRVSGFGEPEEMAAGWASSPPATKARPGSSGCWGRGWRSRASRLLSLWAGLPHYISLSPNPRGTLALVQKLASALALPLDRAPLEREAAEFEERVSKHVAADPALAEYVRELKKREFAQ